MYADYCAACVKSCGYDRLDTLTEPDQSVATVTDDGGLRELSFYRCAYGHRWTCSHYTERAALGLHPRSEG